MQCNRDAITARHLGWALCLLLYLMGNNNFGNLCAPKSPKSRLESSSKSWPALILRQAVSEMLV